MKNRGFTLIELLAVITIMGILMIIAIPAVTRTIENSRKDTFVNMSQNYVSGAKTMWSSDNLSCQDGTTGQDFTSSAVAKGFYYVEVDSASTSVPQLLESGGKSSWGSRNVKGYILIHVYDVASPGPDGILSGDLDYNGYIEGAESGPISKDDILTRKVDYYPVLSDGIHGINADADGPHLHPGDGLKKSESLKRGDLKMTSVTYEDVGFDTNGTTLITPPIGFRKDLIDEDCDGNVAEYFATAPAIKCVEA